MQGYPQKRKKNSWCHQTEAERSNLSGRAGVWVVGEGTSWNGSQGGLTNRVPQWQQGDVLEDAPSFTASPDRTWAGGEQPITSFRGQHTSTSARAAQQHRPCQPLALKETQQPQNLTQKTLASDRA